MPTPVTTDLPVPESWEELEKIVADVLKLRWKTPHVSRNGRNGQAQNGVDIYALAAHLGPGRFAGAQCKCVDRLTLAMVNEEVHKAESFEPPLGEYLIATSLALDAVLQREIRLLSAARAQKGLFPVEILFWNDLALDLAGDSRLLAKHFPGWARLSEADLVPGINVAWLAEGAPGTSLEVGACPIELASFRDALRFFEEDEIALLREENPPDADAAAAYNAEAAKALDDAGLCAQWLRATAAERFRSGTKCGVRISVDTTEARDILVTIEAPAGFEFHTERVPPKIEKPPELPCRPVVTAMDKLGASYAATLRDRLLFARAGLPRHAHFAPLSIPTARRGYWHRGEGRRMLLHVDRLAPRRSLSFDGDDGLVIVAPRTPGTYTLSWVADAANMGEVPSRGTLEVVVMRR